MLAMLRVFLRVCCGPATTPPTLSKSGLSVLLPRAAAPAAAVAVPQPEDEFSSADEAREKERLLCGSKEFCCC